MAWKNGRRNKVIAENLGFLIYTFISIFVIVDPIGGVATFIGFVAKIIFT